MHDFLLKHLQNKKVSFGKYSIINILSNGSLYDILLLYNFRFAPIAFYKVNNIYYIYIILNHDSFVFFFIILLLFDVDNIILVHTDDYISYLILDKYLLETEMFFIYKNYTSKDLTFFNYEMLIHLY